VKTTEYFMGEIFEDPVVQLVIFVTMCVIVMDTFKFIMDWVWKKLGGDDNESG